MVDSSRTARDEALATAMAAHLASAPAYPGATPLTLEEIRAVLADLPPLPANAEVDGSQDFSPLAYPSAQRLDGDHELDELHLRAEGSNLIVAGNLTVDGIIKQDFRAGGLLVLGDLSAEHIVTTGMISCTGNLTVRGTLYGNCTNYSTDVWGLTTADVLVSAKEHYFCMWGGHDIRCIIDVYGDTPNLDDRHHDEGSMGAITSPDFDDGFDEDVVYELLRRTGSILAADETRSFAAVRARVSRS